MSLVSVHRLRLPNGKTVKNPGEYEDYILEVILKHRPSTPKEISNVLAKSTKQIHRYLKNLKENKKIEKIDGSDKYKIKSSNHTLDSVKKQRIIENFTEFDTCESIKKWRLNNNSKKIEEKVKWFRQLCFGNVVKDFRINPDFWQKEETTQHVVSLIKLKRGLANSEKLPHSHRLAIRNFIIYGLQLTLTKAEGERLGISGEKDKPKLSTLHMKEEQYSQSKQILLDEKNNFSLTDYLKFGFRYGTFCRPSSMYLVETDKLVFYDRVIKYIEINDEKITDKKIIQALSNQFEIKQYSHRACTLDLYEPKTKTIYTKHIFDEEISIKLEKYCKERKQNGFKYLFWEKNESEFSDANYDTIVISKVKKDNTTFKRLFLLVGFSKEEFGINIRANYAIRHFGVQKWLSVTDYNYGYVSEMGWEDMATLKTWYGKRTAQALQEKVSEIIY